jgi:Mg2+ and Co2+ transporter CorA
MEARLISASGAASLSMTEIHDVAARDGGTLWLDFDHTDEDGMALLGELMDVRPSDIQECHNRSPVPKMRFYADHHWTCPRLKWTAVLPAAETLSDPKGLDHRARPDEFVVDI